MSEQDERVEVGEKKLDMTTSDDCLSEQEREALEGALEDGAVPAEDSMRAFLQGGERGFKAGVAYARKEGEEKLRVVRAHATLMATNETTEILRERIGELTELASLLREALAYMRACEAAGSAGADNPLVVDTLQRSEHLRGEARRERVIYPYVWRWRTMQDPWRPEGHRIAHPLACRVGHRCRVVARGALNSALVEFEDGYRTVCSRNAIRRKRA